MTPWHVYIMSSASGWLKIGITIDAKGRLADLQRASGATLSIEKTWLLPSMKEAHRIERLAHGSLTHARGHGEWFNCDMPTATSAVEAAMATDPPPAKKPPLKRTPKDDRITVNVKNFPAHSWERAKIESREMGMTMGAYLTFVIDRRIKGGW